MPSSMAQPQSGRVEDGSAALKELQRRSYNLVISDLKMPNLGGLELLVKVAELNLNVVCIIMTGFGTVETAIDAMKRGAYDYVLKPFKVEEVVHIIQRALEKQRLSAENLRLREHEVTEVHGCHIPALIRYDDELWVIEMEVVDRPFVLDFAGAYLDVPPDYSQEVLADWEEEKREQFGDRWPDVVAILRSLEDYGIYLSDVSPGNVAFAY